jgi:hypothetical protein
MKKIIVFLVIAATIFFIIKLGLVEKIYLNKDSIKTKMLKTYKDLSEDEKIVMPCNVIVINGLVWNTDIPQAIINGRVMSKGGLINGVKVGNVFENIEITDINDAGIFLNYSKGVLNIPMRDKRTGGYYEFSQVVFDDYGNYLVSHKKYTQNIAQKVVQVFKNNFQGKN